MTIVLDASVVVELLLGTSRGQHVARRIGGMEELHVPHLLDLEVAQVVRRYERTRALTPTRAQQVVADLAVFDVTRYPHDVLLPRVWELRRNLTAYDAVYIALAEVLGAPLLTSDRKLAGAPGHRASVEVIA
jgi:predicted nucleic acid-binding protein